MWQRVFRDHSSRIVIVSLFLILFVIPLTIFLARRPQDNRTRATAPATMALAPASSAQSPIFKAVSESVPLDIMIDPGTHLVSTVKIEIGYDPTVLSASPSSFVSNTLAFPNTLGPVTVVNGKITAILTIGVDPTKAIQTPTKAATITFKATRMTQDSTVVSFTQNTEILSIGLQDQASENILSTTTPAYITVLHYDSPPSTLTPPNATSSATPTPGGAKILLNLFLHNIGNSGDNVNPNTFSNSNKNPLHPERTVTLFLYDPNAQLVRQQIAPVVYSSESGSFKGSVNLGIIASGRYSVRVKTDSFLRRLIGNTTLATGATYQAPAISLIAGDVKPDNALNILDYNIYIDCAGGSSSEKPITDSTSQYNSSFCASHPERIYADLTDDGLVNHTDLTLFLRELSVQNGE